MWYYHLIILQVKEYQQSVVNLWKSFKSRYSYAYNLQRSFLNTYIRKYYHEKKNPKILRYDKQFHVHEKKCEKLLNTTIVVNLLNGSKKQMLTKKENKKYIFHIHLYNILLLYSLKRLYLLCSKKLCVFMFEFRGNLSG